jgi:uncharacterized protein YodC (DUF2158 family)
MKVGDVVYLNSGSPELTITQIKNGQVWVNWIGYNNEINEAIFPIACVSEFNNPNWTL